MSRSQLFHPCTLFTRAYVSCTMCGEFGGRHRRWGTSLLCTWANKVTKYEYSVRGWRPAVDELAHPQQAPLKLHDETWAGLLQNQGLRISQEEEIVPGSAVAVACPSCPDHSSEPPGPGRMIRNMLGWSLQEKKAGSGVWLFRGVPSKGETFFFP